MRGYYRMYRHWLHNPVLNVGDEPYSRHAAWAWMIEEAKYDARSVPVVGGLIQLERGEFAHTIRFMARAWRWSRGKVERFLRDLGEPPNGPMIETRTSQGQTVIKVCNYNKFQIAAEGGEPQTGQETGHETGQKEKKDLKKDSNLSRAKNPPKAKRAYEEDPAFPDFWAIYPPRLGGSDRKPAALRFTAHVRNGVDPLEIIQGTKGYAAVCNREHNAGTKFVKTAEVFLSKESWRTYLDQSNVVQLDAWRSDPSAWTDPHNPPNWPDAPSGTKAGTWLKTSTAWVKAR